MATTTATAAMRAVSRWADIMIRRTTTTNTNDRRSRFRWNRNSSQMRSGTKTENSVRVGISQSRPEKRRGERLKNAATVRASPSSLRISRDNKKEQRIPMATSPKSNSKIAPSTLTPEITLKSARTKRLPLG